MLPSPRQMLTGLQGGVFDIAIPAVQYGVLRTVLAEVVAIPLIKGLDSCVEPLLARRWVYEYNYFIGMLGLVLNEFVPSLLIRYTSVGKIFMVLEGFASPVEAATEEEVFVTVVVLVIIQNLTWQLACRVADLYRQSARRYVEAEMQLTRAEQDWIENPQPREEELLLQDDDDRQDRHRQLEHERNICYGTRVCLKICQVSLWEAYIFINHALQAAVRSRWPCQVWDDILLPASVRAERAKDSSTLGARAWWLACVITMPFVSLLGYMFDDEKGWEAVFDDYMRLIALVWHWDATGSQQKGGLGGRALIGAIGHTFRKR